MASKRFVVEGTWSGYRISQRKVVHRAVLRPWQAKRVENLHTIEFTDHTYLYVAVRPALPREKVTSILGYSELIDEAGATGKGFVRVADLRA